MELYKVEVEFSNDDVEWFLVAGHDEKDIREKVMEFVYGVTIKRIKFKPLGDSNNSSVPIPQEIFDMIEPVYVYHDERYNEFNPLY